MHIINGLPKTRGILQENVNLSKKSWLGVGGNAQIMFVPADMDDLISFLREISSDINITILGAMSNVIVRSGGIDGVVIILGKWFEHSFVDDSVIEVGGAVRCNKLSTLAMDSDIGGMEFLISIPGTVGGAIKMNAGCYGREIKDCFIECEAISVTTGEIKWLKAADIKFGYRKTDIPDDFIITRVWFSGEVAPNYSVAKKTSEIVKKRIESQPIEHKSCGSTFKNPVMYKAWELIEKSGCKNLKLGGASVSSKHCNFIVNDGCATADDVENLGNLIVDKVLENTGVRLEWEIILLGKKEIINRDDII